MGRSNLLLGRRKILPGMAVQLVTQGGRKNFMSFLKNNPGWMSGINQFLSLTWVTLDLQESNLDGVEFQAVRWQKY